ncbi:MAG: sensor histidine kinase [Saprospiraceae bacterium]|nr:sensor histidine kinase [Saprospiraceae bacterium]
MNSNKGQKGGINRLSFLSAICIAILISILLLILINLDVIQTESYIVFILFLISFLVSFGIIKFVLFDHLGRRFKIIYKLINMSGKGQYDKVMDSLHEGQSFVIAEKDVENWLTQKNEEQLALIKLEEYRREYIGNVSHELKTPIFNIQGFIQSLLEGGLKDNEVNMKFLQKALSNADRLQSIVEDLETISQLESGKSEKEFVAFDLAQLCIDVLDDLNRVAKEKSIKLVFRSEEEPSRKVIGDQAMIRIALTNLVQNAIKYGIAEGYVKIRIYEADDKMLVEIADNGMGIPEESLPKVFDRFYRVDKGRSREMGGSGLGLSIVKHIIEYHDQTIQVRSNKSEGSVFSFTLPLSKNDW